MNKQEQVDDYTTEKIQTAVDEIIADENRKCNADINIVRAYGWIVIVTGVVYAVFISKMILAHMLPLFTVLIAVHQIVLSLAAMQARQARKLASLVAILAVFASSYQDITVGAIREFFVAVEGQVAE